MTDRRWRPRLLTMLLAVNLALLALPLAGIWFLRVYESALVRQTESELIGQAALIAAQFRAAWLAAAPPEALSRQPRAQRAPSEDRWQPIPASLDLADDPILPPAPDGVPPGVPPEPVALRVGPPLRDVLLSAQRHTLAGMQIVDARGIVVASTEDDEGGSLAALQELAEALRGTPTSVLRERPAESYAGLPAWPLSRVAGVRVHVAIPVTDGDRILGAVLLRRTPRTLIQALYGKRYHLVALGALLLLVGGALATFTALTVSRPVRGAVEQARRVAAGERGAVQPLPHRYTREVAELSASLATMAQTLERRADYIRDFAAEIGHEFKTPLAAMRGTVELLRDDVTAMAPEDRDRFLDNLAADIERLERLTRRLLDLARADALRPTGEERAALDTIIPPLVERYCSKGLQIAVEAPAARLVAQADADSIAAVLTNLLDNVRQHAGPDATVHVAWHTQGPVIVLTVADDGPGISAGNQARVFDRFFTTARDGGGTGLGLPIVRSRLAAFGGTIRLLPSDRGATFEVMLPLDTGAAA
ncbi:HAMP domain-containing sensor histidine kinase [Vineibacter terrae]|uniref:sensor histidine kinase n=1 Tax=Vineibacter terrae TaxID=2586908 RepID=UPI002E315443|nr:HAMP domain-containing sensor histidine kinase [Vineibacter terrae]HEX2891618.1 HAMP domain-containing sensor histidine kinase [Vineibacter terrae]